MGLEIIWSLKANKIGKKKRSMDESPNNFEYQKTTTSGISGVISSIVAVRLFFSICVTQAMVFFAIHGTGHLIRQHCSVAVLEWPHTLKVK
jgi:hypothetical protein